MPELPDVEGYRRALEAGGLKRKIAGVRVGDRRILENLTPRMLQARLRGASFTQTRRHGKHLLVQRDGDGWLTLHFGMSGALAVVAPGEPAPPFTRVRFDFEDGSGVAYVNRRMLGRVGLTNDAEEFVRGQDLGPDALDPALDEPSFAARLSGKRRTVKAALMDQSVLAGVGNVDADEILFQARLHPATPVDTLAKAELRRLYRAMRRVLEVAVARGAGSEALADRVPRSYLLPNRGKGGRCPRCGTGLGTAKLGGRTSWLCPRCQREPPHSR